MLEMDTIPLFKQGTRRCYACREGLTGQDKVCYACQNDLTGTYNDNDCEWECFCSTWVCRCQPCIKVYCPICQLYFTSSDYLASVFQDEEPRWLANMVMHYRHDHRAWDRSHPYLSSRSYEHQKSIINEQAKRQIIRKATPFLLEHGIRPEHFAALQGTEQKTLQLALKKLLTGGLGSHRRGM